ncbi:hypothetical protein B7486_08705 [cyanobacterium TDX16]|nr:hypothetical protein B7486_08705 [cyanobacterium TDX16]
MPELARLEEFPGDDRPLELLFRIPFWERTLVLVGPLSVWILAIAVFYPWIPTTGWGRIPVTVVGQVLITLSVELIWRWWRHKKICRAVRLELQRRGLQICIECGYEPHIPGAVRCPECGTTLAQPQLEGTSSES